MDIANHAQPAGTRPCRHSASATGACLPTPGFNVDDTDTLLELIRHPNNALLDLGDTGKQPRALDLRHVAIEDYTFYRLIFKLGHAANPIIIDKKHLHEEATEHIRKRLPSYPKGLKLLLKEDDAGTRSPASSSSSTPSMPAARSRAPSPAHSVGTMASASTSLSTAVTPAVLGALVETTQRQILVQLE